MSKKYPKYIAHDDDEMNKYLEGVIGVVEASRDEYCTLYRLYKDLGHSWNEDRMNSGINCILGFCDKMPVAVTFTFAIIKGHKIMFIDPTSQVVDYRIIDKWLKKRMPKSAYVNKHVNRTDVGNFHNIFPRTV